MGQFGTNQSLKNNRRFLRSGNLFKENDLLIKRKSDLNTVQTEKSLLTQNEQNIKKTPFLKRLWNWLK